jgi:hypothetical protein
MTLAHFKRMSPNEDACKQYLTNRRWPDGVKRPRCGNPKVDKLNWKPFHWVCKLCGDTPYRFSVTVGTVFENTNYPLLIWFKVLHLMLTSKKVISALQNPSDDRLWLLQDGLLCVPQAEGRDGRS